MAAMGIPVTLHAHSDTSAIDVLRQRAVFEGFELALTPIQECVGFECDHGLATPRIVGQQAAQPALFVRADKLVRFGLMGGEKWKRSWKT